MVKRPNNRYSDLGDKILDKIYFDSILGSHTLLEFQIPCGFLLLTRRSVDFGMYVFNCPNRGSVTKKNTHYRNGRSWCQYANNVGCEFIAQTHVYVDSFESETYFY